MPPPISPSLSALRALALSLPEAASTTCEAHARDLGFEQILVLGADRAINDPETRRTLAGLADRGTELIWSLRLGSVSSDHPILQGDGRSAFRPASEASYQAIDPRKAFVEQSGEMRLVRPEDDGVAAWWKAALEGLRALGVGGFIAWDEDTAGRRLARKLRAAGYGIETLETPQPGRFPGRSSFVGTSAGQWPVQRRRQILAEIAVAGQGWAMAAGVETGLEDAVRSVNACLNVERSARLSSPLTSPASALQMMMRESPAGGLLLVHNRTDQPRGLETRGLPFDLSQLHAVKGFPGADAAIDPHDTRLYRVVEALAVTAPALLTAKDAADPSRRICISGFTPSVDQGRFAVKRVAGESLAVRADIFTDGHEQIAADVLFRAADETPWRRVGMKAQSNDVWTAELRGHRLGRHQLAVEAWLDVWGGFVRDFGKKRDAGVDLSLERREGRVLIEAAADRAQAPVATALRSVLDRLEAASAHEQDEVIAGARLLELMQAADDRAFRVRSFEQPVEIERRAAAFSSWYELFPRSQTLDKARHGTFADVIDRLPQVAAMGFDTLYFPPIHPIGRTNRKGPNNTLTPAPHDVGSPYAIGSPEGGHDAIHPELGSLEDFRALVAAASEHGLEIALDFAIQCSPDHPWLKAHPDWFAWRPDGSMKYAENPPKKYQDIVNVDFYADGAVPYLWEALRDVVLFWAAEGIKTFRVDNPHTKPLPFWEWMIGEVKAHYPDAIFLSEAFTRPKPMYQLAKLGFSQSYSYFTWRNHKSELTEYLTELSQIGVREFFRPHFFVNTPDINPYFLHQSGRAGFLIRAALAATLSGLFGVYAGFELCEAAPLAGREEYLDSEKYEVRPRPLRAPGDIVDEITRLNVIRRAEPALQTHLSVQFHNAFNDQVLYYSKALEGEDHLVLVAVSLDPHHAQDADFEVPLWLLGLGDDATVQVDDLLTDRRFRWSGKVQHLRLTPENPYAIWRIAPSKEA